MAEQRDLVKTAIVRVLGVKQKLFLHTSLSILHPEYQLHPNPGPLSHPCPSYTHTFTHLIISWMDTKGHENTKDSLFIPTRISDKILFNKYIKIISSISPSPDVLRYVLFYFCNDFLLFYLAWPHRCYDMRWLTAPQTLIKFIYSYNLQSIFHDHEKSSQNYEATHITFQ